MNLGNGSELENRNESVYIRNLEKILVEEELSDTTRDTIQIAIRNFKQSVEFLKRRNAELVESEQKFKAFAQLGHWEWNLITNKMELSEEAQKIYQLNKNSVKLSVVMDMIHSEDKTKVQEAIDRTMKYHETVPVECRIITPQGDEKWLRADEHTIIGESGQIEKVFGYIMDITERKNAEIHLRENEEKYRLLIENLGEGIGIVDTDENFLYCNQVTDEIFGVPQGGLENRNLAEFVNPETLHFIKDQTQIKQTGKKSNYEIQIFRPNGEKRQIKVTATPQFDTKAVFTGTFGVISDVTEQRQIENALQESGERLRKFMDSATDAFALLDSELNIVEVNQIALNMIGLERQEVINKYYGDLIPDFEGSEIFFNYMKVLQTGNPRIIEDHFPHHSRFGEKYYNMRIFRVGEGLGVIATDITEHKRADQALQKSEENLRQIIKNMPVMLDAFDENNGILVWNRESERVTGYTEKEMIEDPNPLSKLYPDPIFFSKVMKEWTEKGDSFYNWEIDVTHKDGTKRTVSWSNISKHFPIPGWKSWAVGVDITERRMMEEELLEKRKLVALGQMAAGLAHELNTPLTNINLTTDYLLNLVNKSESKFKDSLLVVNELNDIKQQANFCVQIVKDLLLFSRKIDISATSFTAKSFLSEIISSPTIGASIKEKKIEVEFEILEDVIIVGDQVLLSQCFQNIINNSIDALGLIHDNPKIIISLEEQEKSIEVCVRDNGEGIKEENITKVFEPFFTTKKVGEGTGLGLSIVRGIIEKHNGQITVNSTLGEGTEVKVTLPKEIN